MFINHKFSDWLDDSENLEKLDGAYSHITTNKKRILITNWAVNTYHKLKQSSSDSFWWKLFKKTDCMIMADSSKDKIKPEGLPDYKVLSLILFAPLTDSVEP